MQISIATEPGGQSENEDWVGCTPSIAVVLDGLSTAGLDTGCVHGVPWYVNNLGSQLIASLAAAPRSSISDALAESIEKVASLHPECDLKNPGTPSSTVSVVRERENTIEYLVLADSPIVFQEDSGFTVVTDLRVDQVLLDLKAEVDSHETGSPAHRESLARLVTEQRKIRNTPNGYWIASTSPDAAGYAVTGKFLADSLKAFAVLSDGASRVVTEYQVLTWQDAFTLLDTGHASSLIRTVREAEATDPFGRRWPRYKSGDDASVAYCRVR